MSEINPSQLLSQLRAMASAAGGGAEPVTPAAPAVDDQTGFSRFLMDAIDKVNESQQLSSELKKDFQLGKEGIDITQVMIASQKANIEFQMMMQVRNKLINAYKDIMNMAI